MSETQQLAEKKENKTKDERKESSTSSSETDSPKREKRTKSIAKPNPKADIRRIKPKLRQYTEQQLSSSSDEEVETLSRRRVVPYKVKYYGKRARKIETSSSSSSESSDSSEESSESDGPEYRTGSEYYVGGGPAEQIFRNIMSKRGKK